MSTAEPKLQTYFIVYLLLMVGLAATVGVAYMPLGHWNLLAALAIASIKATMVVLIFMHVRYSPRLTWIVVFAALVWLAIGFGLTIADYASRDWIPTRASTELALPSDDQGFQPPREASSILQDPPHAEREEAGAGTGH